MQKSKEWYARRRQGITATDIGSICGFNKYRTPLEVYLDKLSTEIPDDITSESAYWGSTLEDIIAKEYANRTQNKVFIETEILQHPKYEFILGSIDRWVNDKEFILECKTINQIDAQRLGPEGSDEIIDTWLCQVAWYAAICDVPKVDIAVLVGGQKYLQYTYLRNPEFEENLINIGINFWNNHVLKRIPPELTNYNDILLTYRKAKTDSKIEANIDLIHKLFTLKTYKQNISSINKEVENLEKEIKSFMQDNEALVDINGQILATWKNQNPRITIDHKRLQEEMPDIYNKYKQEAGNTRVFRVNGLKEKGE